MRSVTIVIPVYNEAQSIQENLKEILKYARETEDISARILVVNDGSADNTAELVYELSVSEKEIDILSLNRNFGKEAAIKAGLDHASGDAVIVMDSDLQHPPRLLPQMIELWKQGADVVECSKTGCENKTFIQAVLRNFFFIVFELPTGLTIRDQSDFKLLDRKVVAEYCRLPEHTRFFRGLIRWMGYSSAQIYFDVPERSGGNSSWSLLRLARYAVSAIVSFTSFPLHIISGCGLLTFLLSMVFGSKALLDKLSGNAVDGFTTVILLILFIGSALMFSIGLIGIYIAQIYDEVKSRPPYIVSRKGTFTDTVSHENACTERKEDKMP